MAYTDDVRNSVVDHMAAMVSHWTLHSGATGTTGANRITAAGSATSTMGSAVDGVAVGTQCQWDNIPGSVGVSRYGAWDGDPDVDGVFLWGFQINPGFTLTETGSGTGTPYVRFPGEEGDE